MVLLFYQGAGDAPAQRGIFLFPDARRRFRIAGCRTLSRIFCLRRPHFFQQRKKWGKECRQKPVVFGFPFGRFRCGGKRFRRESAMGLPSLPLTWRAGKVGGSVVQAIIKSRTCRQRRQVQVRPVGPRNSAGQRTAARYAGAAAGMGVQAIRCGTFLYRGWNRAREIQKPRVFGGVFASFCRRGQKDVAPEREISLPEA